MARRKKAQEARTAELYAFFYGENYENKWRMIYKIAACGLQPEKRRWRADAYRRHQDLLLDLFLECVRTNKTIDYLAKPANLNALIRNRVRDYFRQQTGSGSAYSREYYLKRKQKEAEAKGEVFDPTQVKQYNQKPDVRDLYSLQRNVTTDVSEDEFGSGQSHVEYVVIDTRIPGATRDYMLQPFLDAITNPKHRTIFGLFLDGATHESIAEQTGVQPETARKTVQRVLASLHEKVHAGLLGDPEDLYDMLIALSESGHPITRRDKTLLNCIGNPIRGV
jgi:hypothetical protein